MKIVGLAALSVIPVILLAQQSNTTTTDSAASSRPSASATVSSPTAATYAPLTPAQKAKYRARRLVEPLAFVSAGFAAGVDQLTNTPKEWGQGSQGYAIRFASAYGDSAVHDAIGLGFDIAFHLDSRYHRMPESGFKARLWNAVSQTLITNKDAGGKTVNISTIAGSFGAGFVANTWEPESHSSTGDALTRGATGLAFHSLKNVVREFMPDVLHRHSVNASSTSGPHT
jgi:hypothetical protein